MIFNITDHSRTVLLIWFSVLLVLVSVSVPFSPSVCLDDIKVGLGNSVATFWERAAHSVYRLLSLYFGYFIFSYFPLSF